MRYFIGLLSTIISNEILREVIAMVKHIILWKLKDEYNTDEVKKGIKSRRRLFMPFFIY